MNLNKTTGLEFASPELTQARLDIVVPFTTPVLTVAALHGAKRLGNGLNALIRLLKIQVVPFPLERSPVALDFLKAQMHRIASEALAVCEIRLAREFDAGLVSVLREHSLVVLATRRRPWRTRSEWLAVKLRRAGHTVVMVSSEESKNNA